MPWVNWWPTPWWSWFPLDFVTDVLGVRLRDDDVRDEVGGLTAPIVVPMSE